MGTPTGSIVRGEPGMYRRGAEHHGRFAPCARCGILRAVKAVSSDLCRDCRSVDPKFGTQSYR